MPGGPRLNYISRNFTSRDSLGIEGAVTSMEAAICPIVNNQTSRPFYWAFMIWIYYDFYKYSGITEHTSTAFDAYLKRQDYFFVLATLLTKGADRVDLVGKQQSQDDIDQNPNGPYPYNPEYFKTPYGGMQYFNAGCLSMYFITREDPENSREFTFPMLRPEGERMAKAFEAVIKDTEYYRSYRRNDEAVPRKVLEEYGRVISLAMDGFDECKSILRHYMFQDDRAVQLKRQSALMTECARFITLIVKEYGVKDLNLRVCRRLFYDHQLPSGEDMKITEGCTRVANKWEIVVGRMYFTAGVEMLWKYMLEQLTVPLTMKEWILGALKSSDFKWDLQQPLSAVMDECVYDFDTRESMIAGTAQRNSSSYSIENGIRILLSVYNHFHGREDFGEERAFFDYFRDGQSIAMSEMFELVDSFKDRTIQDLIVYIIQYWIIERHYLTAFDKMLQGRDGFFYEIIDQKYIRKKRDFRLAFQGIRMVQLAQVMRDLDML